MTKEEVQAEKIDTQKELLSFEEKHGRPVCFNILTKITYNLLFCSKRN